MASLGIGNPLALIGLLLLIPIIILYFLKPKPKRIRIPTLMFLVPRERKKKFTYFLNRLIRDPLLLVQLILIFLLVMTLADPFALSYEEQGEKEAVVLIMDISASMQAIGTGLNRFENARFMAKDVLRRLNQDSSISLVLAENIPVLVLRDNNKEDVGDALNTIEVRDTPTNLKDSVLFARDLLSGSRLTKRIYLFSDFSGVSLGEINFAQKMASMDGIDLRLVQSSDSGRNVGIVEMDAQRSITNLGRFYLTVTVKNFDSESKSIGVNIFLDNNRVQSYSREISGNSQILIHHEGEISEGEHILKVEIEGEDSLLVDNNAYAYIPEVRVYRILLITSEGADLYLRYALESISNVELRMAIPPVIPDIENFDTVILGELNPNLILPGTFSGLKTYCEDGGNVIILASPHLLDINNPNLEFLLPVNLLELKQQEERIEVLQEHEVLNSVALHSIVAKKYLRAEDKNDSIILARAFNSPVLAFKPCNRGIALYMGINPDPEWSNFYYSYSHPIFWFQVVRWMNRRERIMGMSNFKSGEYLPLKSVVNISTPSGRFLKASSILLDEVGVYELGYGENMERIAVNLLNDKESDISSSLKNLETINEKDGRIKSGVFKTRRGIYDYLLILALLFLIMELVLYYRRGKI